MPDLEANVFQRLAAFNYAVRQLQEDNYELGDCTVLGQAVAYDSGNDIRLQAALPQHSLAGILLRSLLRPHQFISQSNLGQTVNQLNSALHFIRSKGQAGIQLGVLSDDVVCTVQCWERRSVISGFGVSPDYINREVYRSPDDLLYYLNYPNIDAINEIVLFSTDQLRPLVAMHNLLQGRWQLSKPRQS